MNAGGWVCLFFLVFFSSFQCSLRPQNLIQYVPSNFCEKADPNLRSRDQRVGLMTIAHAWSFRTCPRPFGEQKPCFCFFRGHVRPHSVKIGAHSHFLGENSRPYGVLTKVCTFCVLVTSSEEPLFWKILCSKEEILGNVIAKAHVRAMWEKRSKNGFLRDLSGVRKLRPRLG